MYQPAIPTGAEQELIGVASFQDRRINRRVVCGKASTAPKRILSLPGPEVDRSRSFRFLRLSVNLCPGHAAIRGEFIQPGMLVLTLALSFTSKMLVPPAGNEVRQVTFRKESLRWTSQR